MRNLPLSVGAFSKTSLIWDRRIASDLDGSRTPTQEKVKKSLLRAMPKAAKTKRGCSVVHYKEVEL